MYFKLLFLLPMFFIGIHLQAKVEYMGYLKKDLGYFKYKDTQIAFDIWMGELAKLQNAKVDMKYYAEPEKILSDFKAQKIMTCSLNVFYYLKNMKQYDSLSQEYWTIQKGDKIAERLVILVRADSKIKNIQDLKNKIIARQDDNLVAELFLDSEMLKMAHHISLGYIGSYLRTKQDSTAILKTFFKKSDACIVPESTLNIVAELNPVIKKKIRVLRESKYIYFPAMMLLQKSVSASMMNKFRNSVFLMNTTKRGKSIKAIFKMKNFRSIPPLYLNNIKNFYLNYLKLRERYEIK